MLSLPDEIKPRLRGISHLAAFVAALPLGVLLGLYADTGRERVAVISFAAAVAIMFGLSSLYHRGNWSLTPRRWLRALDHAGIFILIAGTYTAFGLLVSRAHGSGSSSRSCGPGRHARLSPASRGRRRRDG